ncbi:aldehyde dehydrogenase [Rhodobacterales bacterium]|nr:aldehyde dehydrogenase [Rhodobacterales bacterium]
MGRGGHVRPYPVCPSETDNRSYLKVRPRMPDVFHRRAAMTANPLQLTGHIAGAFVAPNGEEIPVIDPSTGRMVAVLHETSRDEVHRAVVAARSAFERGPWGRATVAERQRALMGIHDAILDHAEELAELETLNTGIPLAQTANIHVARAAQNFRFFSEFINQQEGDVYTQENGYMSLVTYDPIGVCALIGPWNMPLGLTAMKIAGALAFGNTCVVKPSEMTPLTLCRLFQILDERNILPEGVLNLVNGRGAVTGDALSSHPDIDMVSFTGGTETGARILSALARGIKGGAMELGGKSASIVYDDCDLERAVDGAMLGSFMNNGQMCLAGSRLFVHRGIADAFIEKFTERTRSLIVGDPFERTTEVGPMINTGQLERMEHYVASGLKESATLLAGGRRHGGFDAGYYFEPTVMTAPGNDLAICQEEIFAPFATFQIFDEEDEAISLANDSRFGLVGYVWTNNLERAMRNSARLQTGTVLVNTPIMRDLRTGFGGVRQSGLGREGAKGSRAMFTEMKSTVIALKPPALPKMGMTGAGENA